MRTRTFAVHHYSAVREAAARGAVVRSPIANWDEARAQLEDAIAKGQISPAAAEKLRAKIASMPRGAVAPLATNQTITQPGLLGDDAQGFAVGEVTHRTIEELTTSRTTDQKIG